MAAALAAGGCSTYHAKPLDPAAVDAALKPAPIESVKIAAAQLKHPLLPPIVIDGRDGYTPDEIAIMAVLLSPELRALRDERGVAQAQVIQAGILPNPQLAYALDNPHGRNSDPTLVSANSLGLSWDVTSLLTHHDQVASAKAAAQSVDLSVAWQEWQAAQEARLRAFRILSLRERVPLAREVELQLADSLGLTKKAVQLGYRTAPDLTLAYGAWTQAQNARFDLETQLTGEEADLRLALGQPPGAALLLKAEAAGDDRVAGNEGTAAELLQGLEERRLDLVALRYGYESEDATLRGAIKAQFPKINLSINKARDTTPVYTRGWAVAMDVPIFDRNQGQIAIGRATRQQLFDEYVARVAEARSQVGEAVEALRVARAQLQNAAASLPALEQLVRSLETAMKTRNADLETERDARAAFATRRMEQAQLQQAVRELTVALATATGRPSLSHVP